MLIINSKISVDSKWIEMHFVHASGPGGQNVNKVATACQLRFDIASCTDLPFAVKNRLLKIAAGRVTSSGELVIDAREFRSQRRNKTAALERLRELILQACIVPKIRKKKSIPVSIKKRRLENKRRKSEVKQNRKPPTF